MRNPKWTRDELLLTLDFYHKNFPKIPEKNSDIISSLSKTLRNIQKTLDNNIDSKYRNENGVYMKLMNFHHINPEYSGKGLESVSQLDREIFEEFINKKDELSEISEKIKEIVNSSDYDPTVKEIIDVDDDYEGREGKLLTRVHKYRERDSKIVKKKKVQVLKNKGKLECEGCGFNFRVNYGERGEGFIECHHIKPVSKIEKNEKTKLVDLVLLCSNCHRMVHRKKPWLNLEELTELIIKNNTPQKNSVTVE
jgi:5-methylcytosine-specific restriction protein A